MIMQAWEEGCPAIPFTRIFLKAMLNRGGGLRTEGGPGESPSLAREDQVERLKTASGDRRDTRCSTRFGLP